MHKAAARLGLLVGLALGIAASNFISVSWATRNSSGTYSLAAGNPVVSGATISSTTHNNTMSDIATALTDSLDRNGKGAMLAPLELANGTLAAPAMSFDSDTDTGIYRVGANNMALVCGGVNAGSCTASTFTLPLATTCSSTLAVTGAQTNAKGITVTQSTSNGIGVTSTGNGSGAGGAFTGGATGAGLTGTGGATSGAGGTFQGVTSGAGINATGGSTAASHGVNGTGGSGGAAGGNFTGTSAYAGVYGTGGSTGSGLIGTAGGSPTADTSTRFAFYAAAGHIGLNGGTPDNQTGFTNTLTPKNIVKAWGAASNSGGAYTLDSGFNMSATVGCAANEVTFTIVTDMASSAYGAFVTANTAATNIATWKVVRQAGTMVVSAYDNTTGGAINLCTSTDTINVMAIGTQ